MFKGGGKNETNATIASEGDSGNSLTAIIYLNTDLAVQG